MIETLTRTVYRSTTAGRSYFTKRAAIHAEARTLILARHPTESAESAEYEDGHMICRGWHWTDLPRSDVLFRRVCRLIKNSRSADIEHQAG